MVDMLAGAGVRNVYAITGDSLNAVTEAIHNDERINFIHMRHEESGAFAASAEAQLTGRLAVCAGSSGPGHVHLINGLYDAQRANAPVLAIASTCPSSMYGTGYFQETEPTLLFSNCSVYNRTATTPDQLPVMLQIAMQNAVSQGGVSVLAVPEDLNSQPAAQSPVAPGPLLADRLPQPTEAEVDRSVELIDNARTVAIYAGCGCRYAVDELHALAHKLSAPLATTFKSTMYLTADAPNYVGHIGYLGMWSAQKAISNADVIIQIGENFPFIGEFPTDKTIIQVDIRAGRLGNRSNVALGVRSDAKAWLQAVLERVQPKTDTTFLQQALDDWHTIEARMQEPVQKNGSKGAVRPEYVFDMVNRKAAPDAIFTVDTGMNCVMASHYLRPSAGRSMVGSFTHGSMADAMPMAIGAAMACPGRQVISLSGDGGLSMLMGDMLTIIQYKMPVKILVTDNRSLAYVRWEMELAGMKPYETDLTNPDLGAMARSMGYEAWTVDDPAHLEQAMDAWLAAKGPALLSVVTDPDAASVTFSEQLMQQATPGNPVCNFAPGAV